MQESADNAQDAVLEENGVLETEEQGQLNENDAQRETEKEESAEEKEKDPDTSVDKEEDSQDDELPLPQPDVSDEEIKKKKDIPEWMKKKLEREKRAAQEKEEANLALKAELERLRNGNGNGFPPASTAVISPVAADSGLPQREQFGSDAEYFLGLSDFRDNVRHQQAQAAARQKAIESATKEFHGKLKEAIENGKDKYNDFEERTHYVLYDMQPNWGMGEAIVESEFKEDILYFLSTHTKEADKIAAMSPVKAAKEIARIEARFQARQKSNISSAPKVLTALNPNGAGAVNKNPEKMDMEEYSSWYKSTYG